MAKKNPIEAGPSLLIPHRIREVGGQWFFVPSGVVWTPNSRWIPLKYGNLVQGSYERTYDSVCAFSLTLRPLVSTTGLLKRLDSCTAAEWETCKRRDLKKNHNTDRKRCCDIFNERQLLLWIKEIEQCELENNVKIHMPTQTYLLDLVAAAELDISILPEKYRSGTQTVNTN